MNDEERKITPEDIVTDRPDFPFYPGDWLSDPKVGAMSNEERGQYIHLLAYCWKDRDCAIEDNKEDMAQLVNSQEVATRVLGKFLPHPYLKGHLTNKRLIEERLEMVAFRKERSRSGAKGARKKWDNYQKNKGKDNYGSAIPELDNSQGIANGYSLANPSPSPSPSPSNKNNSQKQKLKTFIYSDNDLAFASRMRNDILKESPKFKFMGSIESWANDLRKLRKIDGRSPQEIENVWNFIRGDSFWKGNILSASKLREKFSTIEMKARSQNGGEVESLSTLERLRKIRGAGK